MRNYILLSLVLLSFVIISDSYACTMYPVAAIDTGSLPTTPRVGQTFSLNNYSSFDPDNPVPQTDGIVAFYWVLPEGAYNIKGQRTESISFKLPVGNGHVVSLKVQDDEGWWSTNTATVTIDVSSALDSTWYVSACGDDDNDGQLDPNAFETIQVAIDSAVDGDAVIIAEGVYNQRFDFKGKNITVQSEAPDDLAKVNGTIIGGDFIGPVVTFGGLEETSASLTGLTISGSVTSQGMAAHWKLDENANDDSGNNYNGTLVSYPSWSTDGRLSGALDFDGVDDYVEINGTSGTAYTGITGTSSRTCSAWIKTIDMASPIVSWGDKDVAGSRWVFKTDDTTGAIRVSVGSGNRIGSTNITDGNWHHVAAVLEDDGTATNADNIRLFVDGAEEAATGTTRQIVLGNNFANVKIGAFEGTSSSWSYFEGSIDDVRIYDRALTRYEIKGMAGRPGLMAHWKLDDDPNDISGNGFDGTLNGGATYSSGKYNNALSLDDSTYDYVEMVGYKGVTSTQSRTSAAWIQVAGGYLETDNQTILSWGEGATAGSGHKWLLRAKGTDTDTDTAVLRIDTLGVYADGETNIADGQWHHVAAVYDGSMPNNIENVQLYVDGKLESTTPVGSSFDTNSFNDFRIGNWNNNANFFEGLIDDVYIFERALDETEIMQLYNAYGGGINGNDTSAAISKCVIKDNTAYNGGGINGVAGNITNCNIKNNIATNNGGGVAQCNRMIRNCMITGNEAANSYGGGLFECAPNIISNCTIVDNFASQGGGLYGCNNLILNSIIWGNQGGQLASSSNPSHSCIEGWSSGVGNNINASPEFAADFRGDYHLDPNSPCIDVGDLNNVYTNQKQIQDLH